MSESGSENITIFFLKKLYNIRPSTKKKNKAKKAIWKKYRKTIIDGNFKILSKNKMYFYVFYSSQKYSQNCNVIKINMKLSNFFNLY